MQSSNSRHEPAREPREPVRALYKQNAVVGELMELRRAKWSLRKIAQERFGGLITHGTIARLLKGIEPHDPGTRKILGLPVTGIVYVIGGGDIPPGAQVVSASMCACGQPFISNHPARKRCFICSPYKRKVMKETHAD